MTWMSGLKIMETYKKILSLMLCLGITIISVELLYVLVLSSRTWGMISVVVLRVYRWVIMRVRIVMILIFYTMSNSLIELNWKVLVVGLLPLPTFFVKVIGRWMLIYVVMYIGVLVIVNSNGN